MSVLLGLLWMPLPFSHALTPRVVWELTGPCTALKLMLQALSGHADADISHGDVNSAAYSFIMMQASKPSSSHLLTDRTKCQDSSTSWVAGHSCDGQWHCETRLARQTSHDLQLTAEHAKTTTLVPEAGQALGPMGSKAASYTSLTLGADPGRQHLGRSCGSAR